MFRDKTGGITFGDFMEFLSVISKGTIKDKLMWTFTFYDVDHDGVISRDEMLKVSKAEVSDNGELSRKTGRYLKDNRDILVYR